jgi:hypothetical protein
MNKIDELLEQYNKINNPPTDIQKQQDELNNQLRVLDNVRRQIESQIRKELNEIQNQLRKEVRKHLRVEFRDTIDSVRGIDSQLVYIFVRLDNEQVKELLAYREKDGYLYRLVNGRLSPAGGSGHMVLNALHSYGEPITNEDWKDVETVEKIITDKIKHGIAYTETIDIDL